MAASESSAHTPIIAPSVESEAYFPCFWSDSTERDSESGLTGTGPWLGRTGPRLWVGPGGRAESGFRVGRKRFVRAAGRLAMLAPVV